MLFLGQTGEKIRQARLRSIGHGEKDVVVIIIIIVFIYIVPYIRN